MAQSKLLDEIITFIRSLGISVEERAMGRATLVPGIDIERGGLVIEEARLCKPADLLHEAAHIALTPAADRAALDGTVEGTPAQEMSAIGWTWAASRHLEIDPSEVFHEEVISGNGPTLLDNFIEGRYVGVPMLHYWGLTNEATYPRMNRWLRE